MKKTIVLSVVLATIGYVVGYQQGETRTQESAEAVLNIHRNRDDQILTLLRLIETESATEPVSLSLVRFSEEKVAVGVFKAGTFVRYTLDTPNTPEYPGVLIEKYRGGVPVETRTLKRTKE